MQDVSDAENSSYYGNSTDLSEQVLFGSRNWNNPPRMTPCRIPLNGDPGRRLEDVPCGGSVTKPSSCKLLQSLPGVRFCQVPFFNA